MMRCWCVSRAPPLYALHAGCRRLYAVGAQTPSWCADTVNADESTPLQPPVARQYSRVLPTETGQRAGRGKRSVATWYSATCRIGRHRRTAGQDDGAEDTRAHRCVEGEAQQQDHEELHSLRMKVPTGRGRNKRISLSCLSISSTSQLRVAKTQACAEAALKLGSDGRAAEQKRGHQI